jgi:hypothetical protein
MVKTLLDKIRKGWRNTKLIAIATGAIGLASCTRECNPIPPNYPPEITSTPTTTQVNEGDTYSYDVNATDIDGDTLTYSLPLFPSWLSINSSTGLISGVAPQVDSDTPYDIEVGVSDGINPIVTQNYTLTVKNVIVPPIEDYLDVEGYLQDNETDTGKQGTVRIYDSLKQLIGETTSTSDGHFVFNSLDKKVSDVSGGIIIQARSGTSPGWTSYVRTVNASVNSGEGIEPDVIVNPIRVVPYPTFDCSYGGISSNDNFKTFMNQINISCVGVRGFGLTQLEGIEIIDVDPLGSGSNFSVSQQDTLANKIQDINDIRIYVEGRNLNVQKDNGSLYTKHYSITSVPGQITPDIGWIIVAPKNIGGGQTNFFWDFDLGEIKRVRIDLGVVNDAITTHEFGHTFIASNPDYNGHCNIHPFYNDDWHENTLTIMTPDRLGLINPGVADIKASHIVYEDTYLPREKLDDILGDNFLP